MKKNQLVLDMSNEEALNFFLKEESYRNFDLPPYFSFKNLLMKINQHLKGKNLSGLANLRKVTQIDNVNYTIHMSKDGKYAWRPVQLIHPVLYVSLVHLITEESNWKKIKDEFKSFSKNKAIVCTSIPVNSRSRRKDKEAQILTWWMRTEQESINLSLDYDFMIQTDIADCFGSIYTHSIAWALHGKQEAKKNRDNNKIVGNEIDKHLQYMNCGQTNGIPQGSVLMDFVAEMVLGYADKLLFETLSNQKISDYQILRYRDDYRIFVNSSQEGEKILKALTEFMTELNFKLNTAKTKESKEVISSSIKPGKLAWIRKKQSSKKLRDHLLLIHQHSIEYPNDGSLIKPLGIYCNRIPKYNPKHAKGKKKRQDFSVLIRITVDIAYRCPKTYPVCAAIISRLIYHIDEANRESLIEKINKKFSKRPNTEYMQLWLQRISLPLNIDMQFDEQREKLCLLAKGCKEIELWNSGWISSNPLKQILTKASIIDQKTIETLAKVINRDEFSLFLPGYDS